MNQVILLGNLATEPRRTEYESGTVKTTFKLAVNRPGEDKGADFFWVKTWGKQAESVAAHLSKGSEVLVSGELNSYRKTNDDDTFTETVDVNGRNVKFLRRPNGQSQPDPAVESPLPQDSNDEAVAANPASDDIPF